MAKKYLSPLNLLNLTSDPGTAAEGDFYWNSSTNRLRIYFDGAWADVSSNTAFTNAANTFTTAQTITPATSLTGLTINAAASSKGLIVKANATTPGNLQEWQNSAGTVLSYFANNGQLYLTQHTSITQGKGITWNNGDNYITGLSGYHIQFTTYDGTSGHNEAMRIMGGSIASGGARVGIGSTAPGSKLQVNTAAVGEIGLIVRGIASQTAALQEWQNSSGTVVASLAVDGAIRGNYLTNNANTNPYLDISGSSVVILNRNTVGNTVFAIRGMASQSGNLQVWQNSALTNLRSINSAGSEYVHSSVVSPFNMYTEVSNNNTLVAVPNDIFADKLRFRIGTYEASVDGTTSWTAGTFQRELVDGRNDTVVSLTTANKGHRWTWNAGDISWSEFKYVRLTTTYSSPSTTYDLLVESSANGSTWTNQGSWTGQSAYISKRIFAIGYTGGDPYLRITLTNNAMSAGIPLANIEALSIRPGDQGGAVSGIEENLPLWWNGDRSVRLQPIVATGVPLVTRGFTSQSANLQEWQDSAGNILTRVTSSGTIQAPTLNLQTTGLSGILNVNTAAAANIGAVIRGAASQTADLQQWQDSAGTVLAVVASSGTLVLGGTSVLNSSFGLTLLNKTQGHYNTGNNTNMVSIISVARGNSTGSWMSLNQTGDGSNGVASLDIANGASTKVLSVGQSGNTIITNTSTTVVPLTVKSVASQTADLQQWQNSSASVLAKIDVSGNLTAASFVKTSGTSSQFLKADGSVDSSTYLTTGTAASTYLPLTGGTISSDLTITGSLTVNGTTTNLNSTNLVIEDKNIIIADVASPTNTTADGAGITIKGATDKTFNWVNATGYLTSNVGIEASSFVKTSGTSSQFLKADGSVDSSTYITAAQTFNLGTTSIALNRASAAQSLTGITSIDGSAATLTTSRNIGDVAFNGSANIVPTRMYFKDTRSTNYNPYTYAGITLHLKTNTTDSLSDGGTYHGVLNLTHWDDSSGGVDHQLGLTDNGNMHIRYSTGASSWSSWNKFVLADSTNTFTGQIISTRANNTGDGLGQIYLNGATGNRIDFNTNGIAAPAFTTRSVGTKIVLYPVISASSADYAIGIDNSTLWNSVGTTSNSFKWYGGTTLAATLTGAGALTLVSSATATSFIPSGSSVPSNGMYLQAANTLSFATNTTNRMVIDSSGNLGIGTTPTTGYSIQSSKNLTGAVTAIGFHNSGTVQSDVTTAANVFYTTTGTAAASFTLSNLRHYIAVQGTFGVGSTVTNQSGFEVDSSLIGATNNYAFRGRVPAAANRWNVFMDGTAANYFAGQTTVGSTSLTLGNGSVTHQLGIVSGAAANVGLVIRGAASQSGNLLELQDSSGNNVMLVKPNSSINARYFDGIAASGTYLDNLLVSNSLTMVGRSTTAVTAIVRGAASQTADLQQWQNSAGGNITRIDTYGRLGITTSSLQNSTGGFSQVSIVNANTTDVQLLVKAFASQTANLQEWQSAGSTTAVATLSPSGAFTAITKSFDIPHPTKENMRLRYGSLEGPENGVYVRGRSKEDYICLPDYWAGLVDEDTITVNITPIGKKQDIYVDSIEDNKVYLGGKIKEYFFTVYGERKDVDKLLVEY